jgi:hypothetical protein
MFQQNNVITNDDNMNHHLDFELVENNSKRWNLVSTSKWGVSESSTASTETYNYKSVCSVRYTSK